MAITLVVPFAGSNEDWHLSHVVDHAGAVIGVHQDKVLAVGCGDLRILHEVIAVRDVPLHQCCNVKNDGGEI